VIRDITLADRAQLEQLAVECANEGFQFAGRWRDAVRLSSDGERDARRYFLGVFDGAALLGVCGVTPDPYDETVGLGRVRHVYVAAVARRNGVGRRLLEALETRASATYSALRLRTDTARAAAFYEALGYVPIIDASATHYRRLPVTTAS
jgi:GNAT superfamily N-acetyltransferase